MIRNHFCFPVIIFLKWFLMMAGTVMVVAAVVIMGRVIHDGATGNLRKHKVINATSMGKKTILAFISLNYNF